MGIKMSNNSSHTQGYTSSQQITTRWSIMKYVREISNSREILSTNGNFLYWIYPVNSSSKFPHFFYRGSQDLGTKIYVDSTYAGNSRQFFTRERFFPQFLFQGISRLFYAIFLCYTPSHTISSSRYLFSGCVPLCDYYYYSF